MFNEMRANKLEAKADDYMVTSEVIRDDARATMDAFFDRLWMKTPDSCTNFGQKVAFQSMKALWIAFSTPGAVIALFSFRDADWHQKQAEKRFKRANKLRGAAS